MDTSLQEENAILQQELNDVENKLSQSKADRDSLQAKCRALNDKLEETLKLERGESCLRSAENKSLAMENARLRQQVDDQEATFARRLQAYQDGQQRQAQLVQKLQTKVLQYKRKCSDQDEELSVLRNELGRPSAGMQLPSICEESGLELRGKLETTETRLRRAQELHISDLEESVVKFEEERKRCESLAEVNAMLREQLVAANDANTDLTEDLRRVTADWNAVKEKLRQKEVQFRDEEENMSCYFGDEHSRLLALWRAVIQIRRGFDDLKSSTERDLTEAVNNVQRGARQLHAACLNLGANQSNQESSAKVSLDRERNEKCDIEDQLRLKVKEMLEMEADFDVEKARLSAKVNELTVALDRCRTEVLEKERLIEDLTSSGAHTTKQEADEGEDPETVAVITAERATLEQAVRDIAQSVIADADMSAAFADSPRNAAVDKLMQSMADWGGACFSPRRLSPIRSSSPNTRRSPRRSRSPRTRSLSPSFADSTYNAVQAALQKRQLQVQELRAKLETALDAADSLKKQAAENKIEKRKLENQIFSLKEDLDNLTRAKNEATRDAHRHKSSLEVVGSEKKEIGKERLGLQKRVDELLMEKERLQAANAELQRQRDNAEDEKEDLMKDLARKEDDLERLKSTVDDMDDRQSSHRERFVAVKEALHKAVLDRDIMEAEKAEIVDALSKVEARNSDIELALNKLSAEEAALRDRLAKMQAVNEGLAQDKIDLHKLVSELEEKIATLGALRNDLMLEKDSIRAELIKTEQEKMDLHNEKAGLDHSLILTEKSREKLEQDLMAIHREKADLADSLAQCTRHRAALEDDVARCKEDINRLNDSNNKLNKEKEELAKEKANLIVQLTATERENRTLAEEMAGLRVDKEALEKNLFDVQNIAATQEAKKEQSEEANQKLLIENKALHGDICRLHNEMDAETAKLRQEIELLNQVIRQKEREAQVARSNIEKIHCEDIEKVMQQKETVRLEMQAKYDEISHACNVEKEEIVSKYEAEKQEAQEEIEAICQEHNEALIMAEAEKQQALCLKEAEKTALQEKLHIANQKYHDLEIECEKMKRQAASKQEKDRATVNSLSLELRDFKTHFEVTKEKHEQQIDEMNVASTQVHSMREAALKEVEELKVQLRLTEDNRDSVRRELLDAQRKVRETQEDRDRQRKENLELKRGINDESHEKNTVSKANEQLRVQVKKTEQERIVLKRANEEKEQKIAVLEEGRNSTQKENADLRASLREVERSRLEARRELQEVRRQVKVLDGENTKKAKELEDLQNRVISYEQKEEAARREAFGLKQKIVAIEASREQSQKENTSLQRKLLELENDCRAKERDYDGQLCEAQQHAKKQKDDLRSLSVKLKSLEEEFAEVKMKLSASEGRVTGLENEIVKIESNKREVEFKLASLHSALRRTLGISRLGRCPYRGGQRSASCSPQRPRSSSPGKGFSNTYTTTTGGKGDHIPTTGSPERHRSPSPGCHRSDSPSRTEQLVNDIDPEVVRNALRDFLQELKDTQRERDNAKIEASNLTRQVMELEAEKDRINQRLQQLQKCLGEAEEGKRGAHGRLATTQTALMLQEETIRRLEREQKSLTEKVNQLERGTQNCESEKRALQEKINKLKTQQVKLETEKKKIKEALDASEQRATKLELARRAVEGDFQRNQITLNEKDTNIQVQQERLSNLTSQMQDLEGKNTGLLLNIDRLNAQLTKNEEERNQLKDRVQSLSISMTEKEAAAGSSSEKLSQLQKTLTASEHDRRILQERLQALRQSLSDFKKQNGNLQERMQALTHELEDSEVKKSELENQVKGLHQAVKQHQEAESKAAEKVQKLQEEKRILQERITGLQRAIAQVDSEKQDCCRNLTRLEKDKSILQKTLDKVERERLKNEEEALRLNENRGQLNKSLRHAEADLDDCKKTVECLRGQLADTEQANAQRLIDLANRHRQESELEIERLRTAQLQAERTLEARERAHKQRVKGLEEQVATLKEQLTIEIRTRQPYTQHRCNQ